MSTTLSDHLPAVAAAFPPSPRSVVDLLAPLRQRAAHSPNLLVREAGQFESDGKIYAIPRAVFLGPPGGGETIRIGLFAGIHGDEPAGAQALVDFLTWLDQVPDFATGYCLFAYPVCNPTGYEDTTRHSRRGRDLNREFWNNS